MKELFRQFSFPGGIPSHAAPETPGSIHEGGELGYSLAHAYGAAFDNPDLLVACVDRRRRGRDRPAGAGRGSEQVPRPGPRRHGAADPAPQRLQDRQLDGAGPDPRDELLALLRGLRPRPYVVEGVAARTPWPCTSAMAATLDEVVAEIAADPARAGQRAEGSRSTGPAGRCSCCARPKGWTGPREVDGKPVEGTWRAHQVPLAEVRDNPEHLAQLEAWLRSLPARGAVRRRTGGRSRSSPRWRPRGDRRMSANPHANGGLLLRDLRLPDFRDYAVDVPEPGRSTARPRACWALACRRDAGEPAQLPHRRAGRDGVQPAAGRLRRTDRQWEADVPTRRAPRPRRPGDGGALASTCARAGSRATC